jgi:hypothetical protein
MLVIDDNYLQGRNWENGLLFSFTPAASVNVGVSNAPISTSAVR